MPGPPRFPDGTPARGIPRLPDGTPAHGFPRFPDGTPAHGVPRFSADGAPVRGGHPEQREVGGGWGRLGNQAPRIPGQRQGPGPGPGPGGPGAPGVRGRPRAAGPRQAYVDAFDADVDDDVFTPHRTPVRHQDPYDPVADRYPTGEESGAAGEPPRPGVDERADGEGDGRNKGGKGRAFTGIAAAAVTTVLAVVVAGQVTGGHEDSTPQARSTAGGDRVTRDAASRGDGRPTPSGTAQAAVLTYDQKMAKRYPLGAKLKASGRFDAVPGFDKAPGKGRKYTYRVDIEQGLGLDGALFAEAVQKTLNDSRSWAHNGARTFERISSGKPDFVITLASPGTTGVWCAKSGLDTTEDNVSCDSASTERVMINAYRWAQGSKTYGDQVHAYRQMLINHEVGHRLRYGHVSCDKDGELAPVMQQQTKFLDHDGIHCRANAWPYPGS
ncbi:DUF3152 domain-containing protein [Streptomyces sp. NPDC005485]|uniref:DUF3152 domain-containing protein n=1 Tax=Streptomyces sp. NPDC005485 TaxID=3155591 RepID=UPI0033ADF9E4